MLLPKHGGEKMGAWRMIRGVSKWFISMVNKSPLRRVVPIPSGRTSCYPNQLEVLG